MNKFDSGKRHCLAVITARAGSKGVINKNLRDLGGRPTISYTIETGLACPHIDEVALTTDSPELCKLGIDQGISVPFLRPAHLAGDLARQEDSILHLMDWYEQRGQKFDLLCLLEPTSPLRTVATLNRGFELLSDRKEADAVFSVAETPVSPIYCNELRQDGTLKGFIPEKYLWANRQELPVYYKLSSLVTICRWDIYKEKQTFLLDTTLALKVDPVEAIDIDEPFDFFVADHLIRAGLTNSAALAKAVNGP
jgi:CMP-N-acetylneuraminic acid synthetase